jgi:hypothetical protein
MIVSIALDALERIMKSVGSRHLINYYYLIYAFYRFIMYIYNTNILFE